MKNDYYFKGSELYILIKDGSGNIYESIVDEDEFDRLDELPYTWTASRAKGRESVYAQGWDGYKSVMMHRWIMNPHPKKVIDHINHNTLDNRRENLRELTHAENLQNHRGASKNSKSGVRGVYWDRSRGMWMAQYKLNGKPVNLGRFKTIEEARDVVERERKKVMMYSN